MSASYALLGILGKQPSYGYDLKKDYDSLYGKEKPLAFGQVYATLSRLLRDKKITADTTEQVAGPERKLYAITRLGRKDLESWLTTPEKLHPNTQTVLFVKVVTAILLDKDPDMYLDTQRSAHIERMRELTEVRRTGDLAQSLQADYAIFHLEADLRWIDVTTARLQNLEEEIRGERDNYLLELKDVKKSFGLTQALQGADLHIKSGEIVAIMGPSGSGKSTLLHCLAGIFKPDRGEVWFGGQRLDLMNEETRTTLRRTAFGFVFQFGQLVPELTAEDNVALPLLLNKVGRKAAYIRAGKWFKRLGIENMERHRTGEMSGGQAQRVALARALVIEPKVLFADEPTGSLDSLASEQVMELLVQSARDQGTTVVLVTHDPRIAAYADREVMVRDGKVMTGQRKAGAVR